MFYSYFAENCGLFYSFHLIVTIILKCIEFVIVTRRVPYVIRPRVGAKKYEY